MNLSRARHKIREQLSLALKPAVLWSGGKDSQVLLHLVMGESPDVEVVYFRGYQHATKHEFVDSEVARLGIKLVEPRPFFRDIIGDEGGKVQVIEVFNPLMPLHFPVESHETYAATAASACALEKQFELTADEAWEYDLLFCGQRGDDTCHFWGDAHAATESIEQNGVTIAFPMFDWTEGDVWDYSSEFKVRQNEARYAGDLSANNDYYDICTNCLKANAGPVAWCPKAEKVIPNISAEAEVVARREFWLQSFGNIRSDYARD